MIAAANNTVLALFTQSLVLAVCVGDVVMGACVLPYFTVTVEDGFRVISRCDKQR